MFDQVDQMKQRIEELEHAIRNTLDVLTKAQVTVNTQALYQEIEAVMGDLRRILH